MMDELFDGSLFSAIASGGLERPGATSAYAMALFNGALYVGTGSPVARTAAQAPRIMRYDFADETWTTAFEAPLVPASARTNAPDVQLSALGGGALATLTRQAGAGGLVPREVGYASLTVFQGPSDPAPALYAGTMSRDGALILRSTDGTTFEPVCAPGMGDASVFALRSLTAFGGRLFAAPAGTVTDDALDREVPPAARLYVSADPAAMAWEEAAPAGFGDPANLAVSALCSAHGKLYAGTFNAARGFQLWASDGAGEAPFTWDRIVTDGGAAYNQNLTVTAMAEFAGALYVGSGVPDNGSDRVRNVGPASAELMRVDAGGAWELIAGRPRFSPQGLKVPTSLMGPGFDDFFNASVAALGVHDGALYVGTHQWEAFQAIENGADAIVGGAQVWRTEDGEAFDLVLEDGNGNPADVAVRALLSTPAGLAVGTQNQSRILRLLGRTRDDTKLPGGFSVLVGL